MKRYQVIIKLKDNAIIQATNSKKEVDKWVKAFLERAVGSISIYERNKIGAYDLADSHTFAEPVQERVIGFGRW